MPLPRYHVSASAGSHPGNPRPQEPPSLYRSTFVIIAGFLAMLVLLAVMSWAAINHMREVQHDFSGVVQTDMVKTRLIASMRQSARERSMALQSLITVDDAFERDDLLMDFDALAGRFIQARTALLQMPLVEKEQVVLRRQGELTNLAVPLQKQVLSHLENGNRRAAADLLVRQALPAQEAVLEQLSRLTDLQLGYGNLALGKVTGQQQEVESQLLYAGLLAVFICLLIAGIVARTIRNNEQVLREQSARLTSANQALVEANAAIDARNTELQHFAHIASHDLQEPLRMVISFLNILSRRYQGKLDDDADQFIATAVEGADRMKAMIEGLLQYSRVGTQCNRIEPTDSGAVLADVLADLGVLLEETGARVLHTGLPVVMADPVQLRRVLQNLISNAIKFRSEQVPEICINASQADNHWVFSVTDNGIGLSTDDQDRIFGMFQRLHTRAEYPGTGIGLSICRKIIECHGGRIWATSEPGEGTTFHFTLSASNRSLSYAA